MDEIKTDSFKSKGLNKKSFLYVIVAIVVIAVIFASYSLYKHSQSNKSLADICAITNNQQTLNQAALAISANIEGNLSVFAKDVQDLPNYNKDPNCLYVVYESQMQQYNYKAAKSTLNSIVSIINLNPNFSFYSKFKVTLQDLQSQYAQVASPAQATIQHGAFIRNPYEK